MNDIKGNSACTKEELKRNPYLPKISKSIFTRSFEDFSNSILALSLNPHVYTLHSKIIAYKVINSGSAMASTKEALNGSTYT